MSYYTILSCDPGTRNFGISVVRFKLNPFRYKVLYNGMLQNTINDLTGDLTKSFSSYKSEIRKLKNKYKVDYICAERFMTRGLKGTTIECVCVMLALLSQIGVKDFRFITASQWKNAWNKFHDLNTFYDVCPCETHQIDAVNIGLYGATLFFEQPHFEFLQNKNALKDLSKQIQLTNNGKVKNGRNKASRKNK